MAISNIITKPFGSRIFKLRLSRRHAAAPPPIISCKEDEFRQVFRFLDADNDGKISADELKTYLGSIGESVSREEAAKIIGELSGGEAVQLEFGEFVRVMELRDDDEGGNVLRQAFGVFEEEKGSGCITAEGLRKVLRRLGVKKSVEECKAMIRAYDVDGNGVLDFDEFHKMMS